MDEARALVNDLEDAGFGQEDVPETLLPSFDERALLEGKVVCVSAEDQAEAEQAAAIMASHGAQNRHICPDPRAIQ